MASLLLAAAVSRAPPTFATEFGLDYTVTNLQYGFVAIGRWTVDHQNSSGSLNLRERTDSYNKTLQPRAEVKDYGNHVHYAWHDDGSQPCVQSPLNGTQPPWTIDPAALLIANRSATGEAVEVWRALYASISQCVDFFIRGSYPAGTLETLPYQLLYWGNCTSASAPAAGEVLAQNNSYTNFSVADQPASLFEPGGPCPPAPPPPPPPAPAHPWEPADDCSPQCSSYSAAVSCCRDPSTGQEHGVCMKVSNCSEVGARELIRLRGAQ